MPALLRNVLVGVGLWAGAAGATESPATLAIAMKTQTFVPAHAPVAVGTRIVWTNSDTIPHSVSADDRRFDSGPIQPGQTFEWTADRAGKLAYHCVYHPSMTAVLDVSASPRK